MPGDHALPPVLPALLLPGPRPPAHLRAVPGVRLEKGAWAVPVDVFGLWSRRPFEREERLAGVLDLPALLSTAGWQAPFDLLPYQESALRRALVHGGFAVWAPPGAGKTAVGCAWLAILRRAGLSPSLVVTWAGARGVWVRELERCTGLPVQELRGAEPYEPDPEAVWVVGWELLGRWGPYLAERLGGGAVVFDEIHAAKKAQRRKRIVRPDGVIAWRPQANRMYGAERLATVAARRLGLTATPVPNVVMDLWGQLDLLRPGCVGFPGDFGRRYCAPEWNGYGWEYRGSSATGELKGRLRLWRESVPPKVLHDLLPPKRRKTVWLGPDAQVRPDPEAMIEVRRAAAAARGGDWSSWFEALVSEAATRKTPYVVRRVSEAVKCGQKVVVFTTRRRTAEALGEELGRALDVPLWVAHGSTPEQERRAIRDRYMDTRGAAVLVGTGDAWGESINLQDTDLALMVALPWDPRRALQWEGRFPRLGQTRPVLIEYVVAVGTADEDVAEVLLPKLDQVAEVLDDSEAQGLGTALERDMDQGSVLARLTEALRGRL